MPLGMGAMILAGIFIDATGWRPIWFVNAAITLGWMAAALFLLPADPKVEKATLHQYGLRATIGTFAEDGRPFLVAGTFFLYGNLYFAVTGLLPVFLIQQYGLSTTAIAPLTAAVDLLQRRRQSHGRLSAQTWLCLRPHHRLGIWGFR